MAGVDQSANLGGMLSQIGGSFGSRGGQMGAQLGNMIMRSSAPKVDPSDPGSYRRAAEYARATGDVQSAAQLEAEGRRVQQEADQRRLATTMGAYDAVLRDPNATPEQTQAAYDATIKVGMETGRDLTGNIAALENQAAQRQRAELQAQQAAESKQIQADIASSLQALGNSTDADQIETIVSKVNPVSQKDVRAALNHQYTFNSGVAEQKQKEADLSVPVGYELLDSVVSQLPGKDANDELANNFRERREALAKREDSLKRDGKYVNLSARRALQSERDKLEADVQSYVVDIITTKRDEERRDAQNKEAGLRQVAAQKVTGAEITQWVTANGMELSAETGVAVGGLEGLVDKASNNISREDVERKIREERIASYKASIGMDAEGKDLGEVDLSVVPEGWTAGKAAWDMLSDAEKREWLNG